MLFGSGIGFDVSFNGKAEIFAELAGADLDMGIDGDENSYVRDDDRGHMMVNETTVLILT